ncbi:hypothetical protein EVAR_67648_1 [Eumeta japonica]|uniref:Uncharacterized protein n=1 Tax=Eumeta variegata TaxID=151549 RepID=A0A4C1ZAU4_EUMVA|nr:hypothetical protein EVAR_67648_1 [Eumeta japonica]
MTLRRRRDGSVIEPHRGHLGIAQKWAGSTGQILHSHRIWMRGMSNDITAINGAFRRAPAPQPAPAPSARRPECQALSLETHSADGPSLRFETVSQDSCRYSTN